MAHNRTPLNVIHDVMKYCHTDRIVSDIATHCNLALNDAHRYLDKLISLGMISQSTTDRNYKGSRINLTCYKVTPRGFQCLANLETVLIDFGLMVIKN